jgi:hypothetical protein
LTRFIEIPLLYLGEPVSFKHSPLSFPFLVAILVFVESVIKAEYFSKAQGIIEDLDLAVSPDWKDYFSDLMRRGLPLLPSKDAIETNERQLERYNHFHDVVLTQLSQRTNPIKPL